MQLKLLTVRAFLPILLYFFTLHVMADDKAYLCVESGAVGFSPNYFKPKIYKPSNKYILHFKNGNWSVKEFNAGFEEMLCVIEKDIPYGSIATLSKTDIYHCTNIEREFIFDSTSHKFTYIYKSGFTLDLPLIHENQSPYMAIGECEKL